MIANENIIRCRSWEKIMAYFATLAIDDDPDATLADLRDEIQTAFDFYFGEHPKTRRRSRVAANWETSLDWLSEMEEEHGTTYPLKKLVNQPRRKKK